MSTSDPDSILSSTTELMKNGGLRGLLTALLGGTFVAAAFNLWEFLDGITQSLFRPLRAFADGVASLVTGTFGGPVIINEAGAQQAAASITDGLVAYFGPLAFPIAVGSSMLGIWVFAWFWSRIPLNPLGFLQNMRR